MSGISAETCDQVTIRLTGLIGVFDLLTDASAGHTMEVSSGTMVNFAFYISDELKDLYKTLSGVEYEA